MTPIKSIPSRRLLALAACLALSCSAWAQEVSAVSLSSVPPDLIEAERDYMRLHVGGRSWLIHQTIKSLEARMNPDQFMRIHRSKMIRRDGIVGLKHHGDGAWSVDLGEGGVHRIGRTYLHDVKAIMHGA